MPPGFFFSSILGNTVERKTVLTISGDPVRKSRIQVELPAIGFMQGKSKRAKKPQCGAPLKSDKTDEPTAKILETETDGFPGQMFDCKFRPSMSELDMKFKVQND